MRNVHIKRCKFSIFSDVLVQKVCFFLLKGHKSQITPHTFGWKYTYLLPEVHVLVSDAPREYAGRAAEDTSPAALSIVLYPETGILLLGERKEPVGLVIKSLAKLLVDLARMTLGDTLCQVVRATAL